MSPEEKLILRCMRSVITDQPLGEPQLADWERLHYLADVNRVIPIVQATITAASMPEEWTARFEQSARRRRMRAAVMIEEFQRIHAEFYKAGIQVIPIKGIALSQQIYPSPSMRYFDDIDLLVKREEGQDALTVLEAMGYEAHPNAPRPEWHHLIPYVHRKRGVLVEIHIDLIRRAGTGWGIEEIWKRSKSGSLGEVMTSLLSNEDALIFTALHARHNLYNRLTFLLDGILLALPLELTDQKLEAQELAGQALAGQALAGQALAGQERDRVLEMAKDAGAISALQYLIRKAGSLFELRELPEFGRRSRNLWIANRIAGWDSLDPKDATPKHGPLPRVMELLLMDSPRQSLAMAVRLAAPPRSFIEGDSGSQRGTIGRYIGRLFSRTKRSFIQLGTMVRGKKTD
jgi:hypothetical protein